MLNVRNWLSSVFRRGPAPPERPVAWSAMASLLDDLDDIAAEHEELFDTDVRERLWAVVEEALIKGRSQTPVPQRFGMLTEEGDQRVRRAMEQHVARLRDVFETFGLDTPERRRKSFHNAALRSERGRTVSDFFGDP